MKFELLICWPGIYHDDSELWQEHDDGTYSKPAAAFIGKVIIPVLNNVMSEFGMNATQVSFSDGERLANVETDSIEPLTASREKQWDEFLNTVSEKELEYLQGAVPEGKTVHFQLLVEGEDRSQASPFSVGQHGVSMLSFRLMQELAKKEMIAIYVIGGYTSQQQPVIDYLYSEDKDSVNDAPAFCAGDLALAKKAWAIQGELASSFSFFSVSGNASADRDELSSLPQEAITKIKTCFDMSPDIVLGNPLKLILIRSGDQTDNYSITLEMPVLDDNGDPEDYEVIETFGSSEVSLRSAIDAYLKAGGDLELVTKLL